MGRAQEGHDGSYAVRSFENLKSVIPFIRGRHRTVITEQNRGSLAPRKEDGPALGILKESNPAVGVGTHQKVTSASSPW